MRILSFRLLLWTVLLGLAVSSPGQVPEVLKHSLLAPGTNPQGGTQQGQAVALDGTFAVVGAPGDDLGGPDSGVVKIYDANSGQLLHVLLNPTPAANDRFGAAVAVSGNRVVVGATGDDTGALNAGSAYVYDLASANPTTPIVALHKPTPGGNDLFGSAVAVSGAFVVVGAYADDTGAVDAGTVYVYDFSAGPPGAPLTIPNPAPAEADYFGFSVAISGNRLAVAAERDDAAALDGGTVYVFEVNSATPAVPIKTLNKPGAADSDLFGVAVAISGARVLVGAYLDNTGASDSGSAYLFDLDGLTPEIPLRILHNPAPATGDNFGFAVALSGATAVVSAHLDDAGATNAGSAYVYDLAGLTPEVPVAVLANPSPATGDFFGTSVAVSGGRVLIGAPADDALAVNAGSAFVYDLPGTTPAATLNVPSPTVNDGFGNAVAASGTRVVVGSFLDDTGATDAGSVYIYDFASANPAVPVATLRNPNPAANDRFGASVAISGTRIAVGAYFARVGQINPGVVYVYDLAGSNPEVPLTLPNPNPAELDLFGHAVGISGSFVAVGTPLKDTGAQDAGAVYVFDVTSETPAAPVAMLFNPTPAVGDFFGFATSISGTRVVAGAYGDDTGAANAGAAYVFDVATPAAPPLTLLNPVPGAEEFFGYAVAISGGRVVVGAYGDSGAAGAAYVFDLNSVSAATPIATLQAPNPAAGDAFGSAVAISGTRVLIGAYGRETGANDAGAAFLYELAEGTPYAAVGTLANPTPALNDRFGASVAIDGLSVAVGAALDDTIATDKGAAYLYGPPPPADADLDGLLDVWELSFWPTTVGHDADDDFDRDGLSELQELGLGLSPVVPNISAAPAVMVENGFLTLSITKRAGAAYEVQSAGTLLPGQPTSWSAASTTVLIDNATTLKVRDNFPFGSPGARFLRLKITAAQ